MLGKLLHVRWPEGFHGRAARLLQREDLRSLDRQLLPGLTVGLVRRRRGAATLERRAVRSLTNACTIVVGTK